MLEAASKDSPFQRETDEGYSEVRKKTLSAVSSTDMTTVDRSFKAWWPTEEVSGGTEGERRRPGRMSGHRKRVAGLESRESERELQRVEESCRGGNLTDDFNVSLSE